MQPSILPRIALKQAGIRPMGAILSGFVGSLPPLTESSYRPFCPELSSEEFSGEFFHESDTSRHILFQIGRVVLIFDAHYPFKALSM
jgi:hypothetical protein